MKRIVPAFLFAAVLSPAVAEAQANPPCAAYPPGSPGYAECWQRAYQQQRAYRNDTDSFWWRQMDRRAHDEYHGGE